MVDLENVHSLSDFQRNAKSHVERLKRTGEPEVLTVNGHAEVIVQSAKSYQKLLDDAEFARSLRIIKKSIEQAKAGKVRPMKEFLEELAAEHGFSLQP